MDRVIKKKGTPPNTQRMVEYPLLPHRPNPLSISIVMTYMPPYAFSFFSSISYTFLLFTKNKFQIIPLRSKIWPFGYWIALFGQLWSTFFRVGGRPTLSMWVNING